MTTRPSHSTDRHRPSSRPEEVGIFTRMIRYAVWGACLLGSPALLYQDVTGGDGQESQAEKGVSSLDSQAGQMIDEEGLNLSPEAQMEREVQQIPRYLNSNTKCAEAKKEKELANCEKLRASAEEFLREDFKKAQSRYHPIGGSGTYLRPEYVANVQKKLAQFTPLLDGEGAPPRTLDGEYPIFYSNLNGERVHDEREGEVVYGLRTPTELLILGNRKYHEALLAKYDDLESECTVQVKGKNGETKTVKLATEFVLEAGSRTPARQAVSQALYDEGCKNKGGGFVGLLDKLGAVDCENMIADVIGESYGTNHQGFAFDLGWTKMCHPELAYGILNDLGFKTRCEKDLPHVDWARTKCM